MEAHTPGRIRLKTTGNTGNCIEGYADRHSYEGDDGWRALAHYQPCCDDIKLNGVEVEANYKANGRRLVAAWNACEGIPTAALEAGAVSSLVKAVRMVKAIGAVSANSAAGKRIDRALALVDALVAPDTLAQLLLRFQEIADATQSTTPPEQAAEKASAIAIATLMEFAAGMSPLDIRRAATKTQRERLEEERWRLANSFGRGNFKDGLTQQRIDEIDAQLAQPAT